MPCMGASYLRTPRAGSAPPSPPKLGASVKFRLSRDEAEQLRHIADEDCSTLSALVRRMVVGELRRRERYDEPPVSLPRGRAWDGNVQAG